MRVNPSFGLPNTAYIRTFDNEDFGGDNWEHTSSRDDLRGYGNDVMSSFYILRGYWALHGDINGGLPVYRYPPGMYRSVRDLGIQNDSISCLRTVYPDQVATSPMILLFAGFDCTGFGEQHTAEAHLLTHNDRMNSFVVLNGVWRLYLDADFDARRGTRDVGPGVYHTQPPQTYPIPPGLTPAPVTDLTQFVRQGLSSLQIVG